MDICHLEEMPQSAPAIAERCWRAWWTDTDVTLMQYQSAIEGMATKGRLPSAFVAHQSGVYVGSVLLIEDDLPVRPLLGPWIAALWVDVPFRGAGVAQCLMTAAQSEAAQLGYSVCYLNATDANSPYYEARGFRRIESNVGDVNVFAISTTF